MNKLIEMFKDYPEIQSHLEQNPIDLSADISSQLYNVLLKINKLPQTKRALKTYGVMLDLSRGAVYKVDYLKSLLIRLSLLGINQVWLYLEDNFVIDVPYFGYLRGRYSAKDIKELDDVCNTLGIELVMALQTLGHQEHFLKWHYNSKYTDQSSVLLANSDETYSLIEKMIVFAKENLTSTRIHLGFDETYGLGRGKYMEINGLKPQIDILLDHLEKVANLALKHGFKELLIWSDMLFQLSNNHQGYYHLDTNISTNIIKRLPTQLKLVYWDYYHDDKKIVTKMIHNHRLMNKNPIMASGLWTWQRLIYDDLQSERTSKTHIEVALENQLDEIIFTMWNDDGSYCDFETAFLGIVKKTTQIFQNEYGLKNIYNYLMKDNITRVLEMTKINHSPLNAVAILYDDPVLGIYLNNEMSKSKELVKQAIKNFSSIKTLPLEYSEFNLLKKILLMKLSLRMKLIDLHNKNRNLSILIKEYQELSNNLRSYLDVFKRRWLVCNLPYGLESHEYRISGQIERINTLIERIRMGDPIVELDEIAVKTQELSNRFIDLYSPKKYI